MKKLVTLSAALLLSLPGGMAQELTLTLEQAITVALDENPTIKVAELEIERYDYVRKTTMGSILPQVSATGGYDRTLQNQSLSKGFSFGSEQYNTFSAAGSINLALYAPAVYRTLKMNSSQAEAAVEAARSSRIDLVQQVKSSYYGVLLAEQSLKVLEENAQTAKQTVSETQVKYDNGILSEYDLLTAQVQYSNLQPLILQAKAAIDISKDLLKMYLFIPEEISIELDGELDVLRQTLLDDSAYYALDITENSTLRSLEIQDQILGNQLRVSNAARMPTLSAYGKITYTGNDMGSFSLDGSAPASSGYYWQNPANVGLSLSVPIFSGSINTNNARNIKNQIEQLTISRTYAEKGVLVEAKSAVTTIETSREQMFAQELTVSQATKAYDIAKSRYDSGTGTILELNTARLTLTQSELNFSQAIYDFLVARSEYDKIIGVEN